MRGEQIEWVLLECLPVEEILYLSVCLTACLYIRTGVAERVERERAGCGSRVCEKCVRLCGGVLVGYG